jgi:hypothetical protein
MLPLKCAVVSLYSIVKQRLKCYSGKVCNRLIQLLLTMLLSIEERVFGEFRSIRNTVESGSSFGGHLVV